MGIDFKETAHLNIDKKKFNDNFDRIFGKKENTAQLECDGCNNYFPENKFVRCCDSGLGSAMCSRKICMKCKIKEDANLIKA